MANEVTFQIQTNSLGQSAPSSANVMQTLGICSAGVPGQFYSFSDVASAIAALGQGPLVEALCDKLAFAGGPQQCIPLNPSVNGSVGATDVTGVTGTATVVGSAAPAQTIAIKIIVGGALGTMTFATSVNGGAYSAPVVTTGSPFPYLVPGTLVKITIAAGTYVANDVYTISTLGAVTLVGSGPTASNVTFAASPLDGYDIRVTLTGAGALGTALFTWSVDGGNTTSGQVVVPSGGKYAIPGAGVVLTFAGTFVIGDIYKIATVTAGYGTADVSAACVISRQLPFEFFAWHLVGAGANAAAAAAMAAILAAQVDAAETEERFVRAVMECPIVEIDATIATAFANFSDRRVVVGVGDFAHISSVTPGRRIRRNIAIVGTTRLCATQPSEHPGWVGSPKGPLKAVGSLYPNFGATSWNGDFLDSQRFMTAKSRGQLGYFIKSGNTMAPGGDDFAEIMNCRVMDVACRQALASALPYLNSKLAVNQDGTIQMGEAERIEKNIAAGISAVLVAKGDAVKVAVTVSRTEVILSTKRLPLTIKVTPFGYAESIFILIGFINPALAA